MPETTVIETAELERLRERNRKLAADKSYLELTLRLINHMSAVSGLAETVEAMLRSVSEIIGGTRLFLYYYLDGTLFRADITGQAVALEGPDDELVERVIATREPVSIETPFSETLLTAERFSNAYTWAFPLVVGTELIGAFRLEGLYIGMTDLRSQLPSFFHHAALVLKNEIQGQSRLKKAYDDLAAEAAVRETVENQLRSVNEALEERVRQRTEDLQHEGSLLSGIMETSPVGIAVVDADGQFVFANIQAARLLRMDREEIRRQKFSAPIWTILQADGSPVPEEDLPFRRVLATGDPIYDVQQVFAWPDGRRRLFSMNAAPLTEGEHASGRVILAIEDITHRKAFEERLRRSNRELRAISDCNQTLMRAADEQTLLNDICHIICSQAGYKLAWVGYREEDEARTIRPVARAGDDASFLETQRASWSEDGPVGKGPAGTAMRTGHTYVIHDFETDERLEAWRDLAAEKGFRSGMSLPLKDEHGHVFGVLDVYSSEPNIATSEEQRLMQELAADLSFGIGVMRAREETKRTNELILTHARFFESIDLVNRAIQTTNDLDAMMARVLDITLSILDCDRAFLAYPCDPGSAAWSLRMARTSSDSPESPPAGLAANIPMSFDISRCFSRMLASDGPVTYMEGTDQAIPDALHERFGCQSLMCMALYPKTGKVWVLGLQQCNRPRRWSREEERLFQEVGRRLTDGLSALLAHRSLIEGERRLRLSLEIGHIGAFEIEITGGRGTYTPQVSALWGIPESYNGNLRDLWQERLHPQDCDAVLRAWAAMATTEVQTELQFRIVHPDGTIHWALWWGQIFRSEAGAPGRLVGVSMDITEKRKTEEELEQHRLHLEAMIEERTRDLALARDAAEAANRAKSRFLANISHELRTPLNAILGFTQLLHRDSSLSPTAHQSLSIVNRSGEHLLSMINDVLDLSKIEAGKVQLVEEPFNLVHLIEDVAEMLRSRSSDKGLHLIVDIPPDIQQHIQADMGKLRQALINLMGNAIKFTDHGGIAVRARTLPLSADPARVTVEIEVEDTGPGIPEDRVETLFAPFTQLETVRTTQKGTGLGLSISRSFLQMMGGDITVRSKEGEGSVFLLSMPAALVPEASISSLPSKHRIIGLEPGQPEYRVLVVEDSPENSRLLCELLTGAGFSVRAARNGLEGWQTASEWRPHFIWMDMRMPVMDGYESTQKIRAEPWGKDIAIVAVTASAFTEQEGEIRAAGCNALLRKPYRHAQIFEMMAKYLDVRYVMTDVIEPTTESAAKPREPEREDILKISKDVLDRLQRAVVELEKSAILAIATSVEKDSPTLASFLRHYGGAYDFESIRRVLEKWAD